MQCDKLSGRVGVFFLDGLGLLVREACEPQLSLLPSVVLEFVLSVLDDLLS